MNSQTKLMQSAITESVNNILHQQLSMIKEDISVFQETVSQDNTARTRDRSKVIPSAVIDNEVVLCSSAEIHDPPSSHVSGSRARAA